MDTTLLSDQNQRILQIYNVYRLGLASILLISFLSDANSTQLGNHAPTVFLYSACALLGFSLLVIFAIKPERFINSHPGLLSALFIVDILCLALLNYSSRGIVSGLALLQLVTIAAGSILILGRMSTFLAAIATIATLYSEIYLSLRNIVSANQYLQSGLLGALLFATTLYLQVLAERMRRSAILAAEQASSILSLEQLNHLIIQRMRTGIVVIGSDGDVITSNDTAKQMLLENAPASAQAAHTLHMPAHLLTQLQQWRENMNKRSSTFRMHKSGPQLQANFAYLNPTSQSSILIFLEDSSQMLQRVRQMKLASLGRLSASIAHEIRNPLGAISHATQLLAENASLNQADRRLLQIILTHSERVNVIIDDVLQMSRHKKDNTERINLHDWLTLFAHQYCETHQLDGDILVAITPRSTTVRVITNQLEQILNNLVENGLRYSKRATGKSSITLQGGLEQAGELQTPVLHVIDEGPGIDSATEEHLFEPFHTTEASGTGLGLYISKELCEAHQAQLFYKRTQQGKSCFSIHFAHPDRNID